MKKAFVLSCVFSTMSVMASTFYYRPAEGHAEWDWLGSWYLDASFATPATRLSYSNESCYVAAPYTVSITNGTAALAAHLYLGTQNSAETATVRIETGGTLKSSFGNFNVGNGDGSHGAFVLDGGKVIGSAGCGLQGFYLGKGANSTGVLTNRNGSVYTREANYLGDGAGSVGRYVHDNGSWSWAYDNKLFWVGRSGRGEVEVLNGTWRVNALRLGGSKNQANRVTLAAGTTLSTSRDILVGGFESAAYADGRGELVMNGGTCYCSGSGSTFYLGAWTGSVARAVSVQEQFGLIRGSGAFTREGSNKLHLRIGRGQVIADGGVLDFSAYASCSNVLLSSAGYSAATATNGWYAANAGEARYPAYAFSTADAVFGFGTEAKASTPDLVNAAVVEISGSAASTTYFRGGCLAKDRTDLHLDSLPGTETPIGVWRFGLYADLASWDDATKAAAFSKVRLKLRHEAVATAGVGLTLYRWESDRWVRVGSQVADGSNVLISNEMPCLVGADANVGVLALVLGRPGTGVFFE